MSARLTLGPFLAADTKTLQLVEERGALSFAHAVDTGDGAGIDVERARARDRVHVDDAVLAACEIAGSDRLFTVGGAGAVAALAYGTESVNPASRRSRAARSAAGDEPPSLISSTSPKAAPACSRSCLPL